MLRDLHEGRVGFGASISVPVREMRGWSPERIAAFFAGIAEMVTAIYAAPPQRHVPLAWDLSLPVPLAPTPPPKET